MVYNNQRKMLFLYPKNLRVTNIKNIKDMMRLSEDLKFIVNEVNDFVRKINENYLEKSAQGLPKVECVSDVDFENMVDQFHNVRICLVKFNDIDYASCYDKVISSYKHNEQDISHLISLTINSSADNTKIIWKSDPKKQFDVNIETNINQLQAVLVSIMMDIIYYRYFDLSTELAERKNFSQLKKSHILDSKFFSSRNVQQYYNRDLNDLNQVDYLSICYPEIFEYFTKEKIELSELINELTNKYWTLIKNKLFVNLELQENFVMYDTEDRYKKFAKNLQLQISDVIPVFCKKHKIKLPILLAIKKDSLEIDDCQIIETAEDFLNLKEAKFNYYKLDSNMQ